MNIYIYIYICVFIFLADYDNSLPRLANIAATSLQAEACHPVAAREMRRRGPNFEKARVAEANQFGNESTSSQSKQNLLARPARNGPSEQPTTGQSIRNERQMDQAGFRPT